VRVFEERFADYVGVKYAIAISSGTAALETALFAVGVVGGDEVILPSFTIISCAVTVLRLGATPVLVDVDPDTWCIEGTAVQAALTPHTKAVMPVHMMGHPAPVSDYLRHLMPYKVVEDACQALGAKPTGNGHAQCYSLYANKLITTGEGGVVTTNDEDVADRARSYRNLCFGDGSDKFTHTDLGYNFRLSGIQAALGCAQLEAVDEFLDAKRKVAYRYRKNLGDCEALRLQATKPWAEPAYWMNGIVLRDMPAREMIARLYMKGIEARPFFRGLHQQPALDGKYKVLTKEPTIASDICARNEWLGFPVTEELADYGLYLPSGPGLQDHEIDYICEQVREITA
jgi:perosamine synthetase